MGTKKDTEKMHNMPVPTKLHTAVKLIRKHKNQKTGQRLTLSESLWLYIQDKDPALAAEAEAIAAKRKELAELFGEEVDE